MTTVSIFLKAGSVSMLTTIISSGNVEWEYQWPLTHLCHHFTPKHRKGRGKKCICGLVHACCWPVVGLLVWAPEDELAQAGHSVRAHQSVAAESPAVHHSDVEWWVKQLVLRQILTHVNRKTLHCNSKQPFLQLMYMEMGLVSSIDDEIPLQTTWPGCWSWGFSCSWEWGQIALLSQHIRYRHEADQPGPDSPS